MEILLFIVDAFPPCYIPSNYYTVLFKISYETGKKQVINTWKRFLTELLISWKLYIYIYTHVYTYVLYAHRYMHLCIYNTHKYIIYIKCMYIYIKYIYTLSVHMCLCVCTYTLVEVGSSILKFKGNRFPGHSGFPVAIFFPGQTLLNLFWWHSLAMR